MRSSFTFNQKDQKIHSITNEIFPKFFFHAFLFVIPIKYPISLMLAAPSPPTIAILIRMNEKPVADEGDKRLRRGRGGLISWSLDV